MLPMRSKSLDQSDQTGKIYIQLPLCRVSDPDPVFFPALDPDLVFKFLWFLIRIRFQPGLNKECRKSSKSDLSEEKLKIMTAKNEKGNNFLQKLFKTVNIRPDPKRCS